MQRPLLIVLGYLTVAILLTWPAAEQLGIAVPGAERVDTWNSLWSLNHWATSLWSGEPPWVVESLNFPKGGTLLVV